MASKEYWQPDQVPGQIDKPKGGAMTCALALLLALACAIPAQAGSRHHHRYYNYPGDQVNRAAVYRYDPPENGGYRFGGRGADGKYHDNTTYRD
jgi:hypothetical protein